MGLCICLFDITKLEDAYVFPGDGASHTKGGCPFLLGLWVSWASVFGAGSLVWGLGDLGPSPGLTRNWLGGDGQSSLLWALIPSKQRELDKTIPKASPADTGSVSVPTLISCLRLSLLCLAGRLLSLVREMARQLKTLGVIAAGSKV